MSRLIFFFIFFIKFRAHSFSASGDYCCLLVTLFKQFEHTPFRPQNAKQCQCWCTMGPCFSGLGNWKSDSLSSGWWRLTFVVSNAIHEPVTSYPLRLICNTWTWLSFWKKNKVYYLSHAGCNPHKCISEHWVQVQRSPTNRTRSMLVLKRTYSLARFFWLPTANGLGEKKNKTK